MSTTFHESQKSKTLCDVTRTSRLAPLSRMLLFVADVLSSRKCRSVALRIGDNNFSFLNHRMSASSTVAHSALLKNIFKHFKLPLFRCSSLDEIVSSIGVLRIHDSLSDAASVSNTRQYMHTNDEAHTSLRACWASAGFCHRS